MRTLVEERLWTGTSRDAREPAPLLNAGIGAVVDLAAEEPVAALPRDMLYFRIPLIDGASNEERRLRLSTQLVASLLDAALPTIVCCGAGMSRSLTIAIIGMAIAQQASADELMKSMSKEGAHDVSPVLWHETLFACQPFLPKGGSDQ